MCMFFNLVLQLFNILPILQIILILYPLSREKKLVSWIFFEVLRKSKKYTICTLRLQFFFIPRTFEYFFVVVNTYKYSPFSPLTINDGIFLIILARNVSRCLDLDLDTAYVWCGLAIFLSN